MHNTANVNVTGRCIISDDLGNIVLDKTNAIHPMNVSRAFARGLSNESNQFIKRIAFGNGGTFVDIAQNITYNFVNDGIYPDVSGYKSKLYNETYSEIVDELDINIGEGVSASKKDDPTSSPNSLYGPGVVSVEQQNLTTKLWNSKVITTCVLNRNEPKSQYVTDLNGTVDPANSVFEFDEIGLFLGGVTSDVPTSGVQTVSFMTPNLYVNTGLKIDTNYTLTITVDSKTLTYQIYTDQASAFMTTVNNVDIYTYRFVDLVALLNDSIPQLTVAMSEGNVINGSYFGYMTFTSKTTGTNSEVLIKNEPSNEDWLFGNIELFAGTNEPISGVNVGVQNNANEPASESARLLTHLIFEPIRKPMNRTYVVKYILDIVVARTVK
jgi:hypothetical protein